MANTRTKTEVVFPHCFLVAHSADTEQFIDLKMNGLLGIREEDFNVYFDAYVWPRYEEYAVEALRLKELAHSMR